MRRRNPSMYRLVDVTKAHRRTHYPFASMFAAAIEIQRVFRGYKSRQMQQAVEYTARFAKELEQESREKSIMEKYQTVRKSFLSTEEPTTFIEDNLTMIQSKLVASVAHLKNRKYLRFNSYKIYEAACIAIQRQYRVHKNILRRTVGVKCFIKDGRLRFYNVYDDLAGRIQQCWKNYLNREIFKFYNELIKFREKAPPREILRSINPTEAKYLDSASGVHIRFRLGGSKFPPTVFYKIFIHSPLIDINAFAPRDYTKHKQKSAVHTNSKGHDKPLDKSNWYVREDRNGWRPVTEKAFNEIEDVGVFSRSAAIKARMKDRPKEEEIKPLYHYSKLKRQQDIQKKREKRKLEWMKKTYNAGKIQEMKQRNGDFDSGENEEEFNELMNWSENLDFDKYVSDWCGLATTLGSDYTRPEYKQKRQDMYGEVMRRLDDDEASYENDYNNDMPQMHDTPTPEMLDPNYRFGVPNPEFDLPEKKVYSAYTHAVDRILLEGKTQEEYELG
ncbi:myosin head domain [Acrasis kona]|uniref:Myosin head domain n=1 Tax=Acrasis kona TaxID=1008807 RepID=A0AAW2ZGU9_9EUKA